MSGLILFLAYAIIFLALLGILYWCLQSIDIPEPVKKAIIVITIALAVIYFISSGAMPNLLKY